MYMLTLRQKVLMPDHVQVLLACPGLREVKVPLDHEATLDHQVR